MTADREHVWVLPGEPLPVRLMNTIWGHRGVGRDELQTPDDAAAWLRLIGYETEALSTNDYAAVRRLRDALRRTAAYATSDPRPEAASPMTDIAEAVEVINGTAAGSVNDRLTIAAGTIVRRAAPKDSIADGLAAVGRASVDLFSDPEQRLRACLAPGCVLYFQQSHPRREWCSVACGNRARAARHYQRHHGTASHV